MAANIRGQVLGGKIVDIQDAETVKDVYDALDLDGTYTATVNGETADMDDDLNDYAFVSFAPAVKGGV